MFSVFFLSQERKVVELRDHDHVINHATDRFTEHVIDCVIDQNNEISNNIDYFFFYIPHVFVAVIPVN